MNDFSSHRQPEVDIVFIQAKTRLAITLACGGMLSLIVGLLVLLFGASTSDKAIFSVATIEVSASGIGAVIMATSVMWAYIAYKVRPTYSASHRVTHKVAADGSEAFYHAMDTTQQIPKETIKQAIEDRRN